jgi:hypothetical protein
MAEFDVPIITKCNTCKAAFSTVELVREHYRTDWHVFNSRRRASNLPHVSLQEYRKQFPPKKKSSDVVESKQLSPSRIISVSTPPKQIPVEKSVPPPVEEVVVETKTATENDLLSGTAERSLPLEEINDITTDLKKLAINLGVNSDRVDSIIATAVANDTPDDEELEGDETGDLVTPLPDNDPVVIEPNVSIFDNSEFDTFWIHWRRRRRHLLTLSDVSILIPM